jgi:hypothetical protein
LGSIPSSEKKKRMKAELEMKEIGNAKSILEII